MYIDFALTTGDFDGGLFGVFLRNVVSEGGREVAVVGGGGELRTFEGLPRSKPAFSMLQLVMLFLSIMSL
ncbi:hypothetical protein D5086_009101 [Populus alba]|uniref:Uncharacterized protein n=1 Tax=Populus alba TaxID=43335 RepID=A0ACC4CHB3_POPAL